MARLMTSLKTAGGYALIIALGLGGGYAVSTVPGMFQKEYVQGDYAAYFPDRQTKVVLYGTDWCGYCAQARAHLKANNIPFADLDIEKSESARKQHAALGGGGVPLLLIGDRKITGFNAPVLDSAIKNLGG